MPVPAIPPEILEEVLKHLPPADADTIPTLLSCMLVSRDFAASARLDSIWRPLSQSEWTFGRIPQYVELSDGADHEAMEAAFPASIRSRPSFYDRVSARSQIKAIIDRHPTSLLAEPSNKIHHILAIAGLGEVNAMPFLDELAFMSNDECYPYDWLSRRYWARQARGAISRKQAVDVWSRIGDGTIDEEQGFWEGIFAFAAFAGSQDLDDVRLYLPLVVDTVESIRKILERQREDTSRSATQAQLLSDLGATMAYVFARTFHLSRESRGTRHFDDAFDCFPNQAIRQLEWAEDEAENEPVALELHPMLLAALLCAAVHQHGGKAGFKVRPVELLQGTILAYSIDQPDEVPEEWGYFSFYPGRASTRTHLRAVYDKIVDDHPFTKVDLDKFCAPTPTRDLIHCFASDLSEALGDQNHLGEDDYNLSIEAFALGRYGCSLAALLCPRSDRTIGPHQHLLDCERQLLMIVASLVRSSFACDAELVGTSVVSRSNDSDILKERLLQLMQTGVDRDRAEPEILSISVLASPLQYSLGDVVKGHTNSGEDSFDCITYWSAHDFSCGKNTGDGPRTQGLSVMYHFLSPTGLHRGSNHPGQPYTLSEEELKRMTRVHDIGKYFRAVDLSGERPIFLLADDRRKLFPDS